ncbi:MAG: hypothetical protein QXD48_04040 [Candidatus Aenigmatarchaeota archaeon]
MLFKLKFILILIIFAKLCFSDEKYRLCFKIDPLKKSFKINEEIIIKLTLINCGDKAVYLFPHFSPEVFYAYEGCFPVIKFNIVSSKNKKLNYQYKGNICQYKYKLPGLKDFFPLLKDYFYGCKISINKNEYEYGPFEEGKYKIKAVYSSKARSCNMKRYEKELNSLSSNIDKEKLYNIFEGEIYSNEIEIEIIK